jgi:hypothetical protein
MNKDMHDITDTTPEAHQLLVDVYRRMSGEEKMAVVARLNRMTRDLFAAGVRKRRPDATDNEITNLWMKSTLPRPLYEEVRDFRRQANR